MKPYALISLALAVLVVPGAFAQAAEIRLLSSNGVHSVMVEMVPAFERATGHKVSVDYYTANQVLDQDQGRGEGRPGHHHPADRRRPDQGGQDRHRQ